MGLGLLKASYFNLTQDYTREQLRSHMVEIVKGTWDFYPLAGSTAAWAFLMEHYRRSFGDGNVRLITWIGPRLDLQDCGDSFGYSWVDNVK